MENQANLQDNQTAETKPDMSTTDMQKSQESQTSTADQQQDQQPIKAEQQKQPIPTQQLQQSPQQILQQQLLQQQIYQQQQLLSHQQPPQDHKQSSQQLEPSQKQQPYPPPPPPPPQNIQQTTHQTVIDSVPNVKQSEQQSHSTTPSKAVVTKVKLSDELNIFYWSRATDLINQIAEKAKNSVDSVITVLDPGMKEYLYSGGHINIIVISDSNHLVSPVRDAFQTVFGRATVTAAKTSEHPIKLSCGFDEAISVAKDKIKILRLDTSNVPRNQVVVAVQPSLVTLEKKDSTEEEKDLIPKWFVTFSMIIEDPVLGVTMNAFSQLIPIDTAILSLAREAKFPEGYSGGHLGFAISIDDLMTAKLKLPPRDPEHQNNEWMQVWSGLNESRVIQDLGLSLAHLYRRRWSSDIARP